MPIRKKRRPPTRPTKGAILTLQKAAWDIPEWCAALNGSRSGFYNLKGELAPESVWIGKRHLVIESPKAYVKRIAKLQAGRERKLAKKPKIARCDEEMTNVRSPPLKQKPPEAQDQRRLSRKNANLMVPPIASRCNCDPCFMSDYSIEEPARSD